MTAVKKSPPAVPGQRTVRLIASLKTAAETDEAVRALTRTLAADLGRRVTQDEVIAASVKVAGLHLPLLMRYMGGGQ
jgi:site-specific recombinase